MDGLKQFVGFCGQNCTRVNNFSSRILPMLPKSGKGEWGAVGAVRVCREQVKIKRLLWIPFQKMYYTCRALHQVVDVIKILTTPVLIMLYLLKMDMYSIILKIQDLNYHKLNRKAHTFPELHVHLTLLPPKRKLNFQTSCLLEFQDYLHQIKKVTV